MSDNAKEQCIIPKKLENLILAAKIISKEGYTCSVIDDGNFQCIKPTWFFQKADKINLELKNQDKTLLISKSSILNDSFLLKELLTYPLSQKVIIEAEDIHFYKKMHIKTNHDITYVAKNNIVFEQSALITQEGVGDLYFKSGMGDSNGSVIFKNMEDKQLQVKGTSNVYIYYNPKPNENNSEYQHKYHNPYKYSNHIESVNLPLGYMLVNNIEDLQSIQLFLSGNYALSADIDGLANKFSPIKHTNNNLPSPFTGNFDGNKHTIKNLRISSKEDDFTGIFGLIAGSKNKYSIVQNINFENIDIEGKNYLGTLAGMAEYSNISNVFIKNSTIKGDNVIGGLIGTLQNSNLHDIQVVETTVEAAVECKGLIAGAALNIKFENNDCYELQHNCFCIEE